MTKKTDKHSEFIRDMNDASDAWTVENAIHVLEHPTVDSKIWAEAVEWLLLYGPPNIKDMLLSASGSATDSCFPEMGSAKFTKNAEPCYSVAEIAKALGVDEEEIREIISDKEKIHNKRFSLEDDETMKKN